MIDLHSTIPNSGLIDAVRIVAFVMGGAIAVTVAFYLKDWKCLSHTFPQKMRFIALMLYGIIVSFQQLEQLGSPLLIWRLPLILVANTIALYGLYAEHWDRFFRPRKGAEPLDTDWASVIAEQQRKQGEADQQREREQGQREG